MKISVIIPTLNEADNITQCLQQLQQGRTSHVCEIIVVDACSSDGTAELARQQGATVITLKKKSRAAQMNLGAKHATGDVLYFVHGDVIPPANYAVEIIKVISEGFNIGRFRFRFNSNKFLLKINSWFTRFDKLWVSGGDETLFVTRELFNTLNGYDESFIIMEEYDFVVRARKTERYKVIQQDVLVSPRKYDNNSWFKVQKANYKAFKLFKQGTPPQQIKEVYYKMIAHPKN